MNTMKLNSIISRRTLLLLLILHPVFLICFYKGHFLIVLCIGIVVLGIDIFWRNGKVWFASRTTAVYIFFFLPVVSVLWSIYPAETFWRGGLVLVNSGIFYLMLRANADVVDAVISRIIILVPVVMAITFLIIYAKYGSIRANSMEMGEIVKSIANVGPAMVIPCIPYLLLFPSYIVRRRNIYVALFACLVVVVLSESRSGMLVSAIMIPVSICFYPAKIKWKIFKIIKWVPAVALVIFVLIFFSNIGQIFIPVFERIQRSQVLSVSGLLKPANEKGSDYGRALSYSEGIRAIRENPFQGIGYASSLNYMKERHAFACLSHNIIITAWGEMGLPGLFCLFWILLSVFFGLRRCLRSKVMSKRDKLIASATMSSVLAIFVHAQFRPLFSNPMFPIILAQAYTMIRFERKQRLRSRKEGV